MSKRYEFHSKLSPVQIFARMEVHQMNVRRIEDQWAMRMAYRRKKGYTFLLYISYLRATIPGVRFLGTVEQTEGGSVIRGKFALWGSDLRTCLMFLGFPICIWLLLDRSISAFSLGTLIMNMALFFGLFVIFRLGSGESNVGPVLNYIEKNLLE